jgi:hypothetical protein
MIPKQPAADKQVKIGGGAKAKVVAPPAPAPALAPAQEMRSPPNIDELLKNIKQSVVVPPGNGPPAAVPASALRGANPKKNAGSTGKNSVVIKL